MALSDRATGSAEGSGTSQAVTASTAASENDVIYIGCTQYGDDAKGTASVTGFTEIASIDTGESRLSVMRKVAGASEGTSYTVSITASQEELQIALLTVIGANTTTPDPTVVSANDTSANATYDIPAITFANANSYDLVFVTDSGILEKFANNTLSGWGTSLVEDVDVAQSFAIIGMAHVVRASSGSQAATSVTSSIGGMISAAIRIEVAEAVATGEPYSSFTPTEQLSVRSRLM